MVGRAAAGRILRQTLGAAVREPLVLFLVVGGLLFAGDRWLGNGEREAIVVGRETRDFVVGQREEVALRPLTDEEKRAAVETYIDDEVLLREAVKLGLGNSGRVRQQLTVKMRYLLSEEVPEPTEAELRAFYRNNPERYRRPEVLSLEMVFMQQPEDTGTRMLVSLRNGASYTDFNQPPALFGKAMHGVSRNEFDRMLGREPAAAIFALPDGEWQGPIVSEHGLHFVRITERLPSAMPEFAEVVRYLREDWELTRKHAIVARKLARLRRQYDILVDGQEAPGS